MINFIDMPRYQNNGRIKYLYLLTVHHLAPVQMQSLGGEGYWEASFESGSNEATDLANEDSILPGFLRDGHF